jgi:hypothetical protein
MDPGIWGMTPQKRALSLIVRLYRKTASHFSGRALARMRPLGTALVRPGNSGPVWIGRRPVRNEQSPILDGRFIFDGSLS